MGKIMYRGEQFPGGPNVLSELRDVNFSSVQDKQIILYDSTSRTWKNHTITAADVAYDANNTVEDAIDTLNSALTTVQSLLDGKATFSLYPITNGYRLLLTAISGTMQFDFGTGGSIANRIYFVVKDSDGNIVFNKYLTGN